MDRSRDRDREGDVRPNDPAPERRIPAAGEETAEHDALSAEAGERKMSLREERLTARKETHRAGEVVFQKEIVEEPGRLEVDARHQEVEVEHVPVNKEVREKEAPWREGDTVVVPVYEEQLVAVKRLVMREQIRIRRVEATERQTLEDTLRKERLRVIDQDETGAVRERYVGEDEAGERGGKRKRNPVERLARRVNE